jgi:hypothetical protein
MSTVKVEYRSKRAEMDRICNTYGREKCTGFSGEICGKETTWKTQA